MPAGPAGITPVKRSRLFLEDAAFCDYDHRPGPLQRLRALYQGLPGRDLVHAGRQGSGERLLFHGLRTLRGSLPDGRHPGHGPGKSLFTGNR